jgi:hypothetical protein
MAGLFFVRTEAAVGANGPAVNHGRGGGNTELTLETPDRQSAGSMVMELSQTGHKLAH